MINIQILSQQPLTCVDLIPARTKNTHLLFGFDFNTMIKDEKETHPINRFMDRFIWLTRRYVLNNSAIIKKLSLKELVNDLKEDMHNDVLFNIQEFQKNCHNPHQSIKIENILRQELIILERLKNTNFVFLTCSLDEDNDTFVIHDSFQNGQQMLELKQTTQGLLHQIDIKRASFSNQGELLLSIKYQKED